ncbi:flavin monoamine oxidase family protein [Nocardia flavorosea]|uniref:FAD-dependent oxidoreductase n=1 Tax=Nocardia flavorosea TaxID=53429 RepID=A0A846YKS1_9NOCA|nr:FAD-dependent oxidoreductase [Nocardia flavorosea]NKY59555.1 FAD-dependent oxidoreductase [Nocardia flavorosea]
MNTATDRTADVVIVGAGLSGLTSADQLIRAGYEVVVLEGRDRVGGRIRTTEIADVPVDAGATWVAPDHDEVHALAARLGIELVPQFHQGKGVISLGGKRRVESLIALAPWVMADIARVMSVLQKCVDEMPVERSWEHVRAERWDAMSFGEWLRRQRALKQTRSFMRMVCLVHWGAPPSDVSLFNVMRYIKTLGGLAHMLAVEGGDQQDRFLGTAHRLARGLADAVDSYTHPDASVEKAAAGIDVPRVLVDSAVEHITTDDDRVVVESRTHRICARYVIVTASPMHRAAIEFSPTLPDHHYGLARSWRLGALSKAFVAYDHPFWRDHGLSGEGMSDDDTVFLTFDVSPDPAGPGILMAFCDGRGFDAHPPFERRRRVIDHLAHLYGDRARNIIDYTDFSWGNDSFAPGGPNPAVGPKAWTGFGPYLHEPVGRIHWAGSETADQFSGTMNGAILSGQRAATEVVTRLEGRL